MGGRVNQYCVVRRAERQTSRVRELAPSCLIREYRISLYKSTCEKSFPLLILKNHSRIIRMSHTNRTLACFKTDGRRERSGEGVEKRRKIGKIREKRENVARYHGFPKNLNTEKSFITGRRVEEGRDWSP